MQCEPWTDAPFVAEGHAWSSPTVVADVRVAGAEEAAVEAEEEGVADVEETAAAVGPSIRRTSKKQKHVSPICPILLKNDFS